MINDNNNNNITSTRVFTEHKKQNSMNKLKQLNFLVIPQLKKQLKGVIHNNLLPKLIEIKSLNLRKK